MANEPTRVFTEEDVRNLLIYLDIKEFDEWQLTHLAFCLNNRKKLGRMSIAAPRRK